MALVTGTPIGNIETQEDIFVEGAPSIYIQDASASPRYNPDTEGFYWGMTGTTTYPVYEIGCPTDLSFSENITINEVLCDNVGVKATIQQRNYIQFTFTIQSFFPLQTLRVLLKGGVVTENTAAHTQKFGFGPVDVNQFWMVYTPKVYDTSTGAYVWLHLHRAQFVDAWTINMPFGSPWQIVGLQLRAYADTTKPQVQQFGMFGRLDPSAI